MPPRLTTLHDSCLDALHAARDQVKAYEPPVHQQPHPGKVWLTWSTDVVLQAASSRMPDPLEPFACHVSISYHTTGKRARTATAEHLAGLAIASHALIEHGFFIEDMDPVEMDIMVRWPNDEERIQQYQQLQQRRTDTHASTAHVQGLSPAGLALNG